MSVNKKSKRKQPETEDYDSCSDFEDELKNSSSKRNSKKKKLLMESESESDSHVSETAENEAVNETSDEDEDEPINKVLEKSQVNKNSKKMIVSSDSSDEDVPLKTLICSKVVDNSSTKSKSEENGVETSDDDVPISKMIKPEKNGKSKNIDVLSESSDDEPLTTKTSSNHSLTIKNSKSSKTESEDNSCESSDDSDESISKMVKKSKQVGKSANVKTPSVSSSDDEPLAAQNSPVHSENKKSSNKVSELVGNGCESSDDSDEIISKMIIKSKQVGKSAKVKRSSVSSSDDEPLATQNSPVHSKSKKGSKKVSEPVGNGCESSDDSDEIVSKMVKKPKQVGKSAKVKTPSVSSSDDEPLAAQNSPVHSENKKSSNKVSEPVGNGHVSSDEDEPLDKLQKSTNEKHKKVKSSSNDKIEHLKKYLRLSGIHIQSYDKLFVDCKSIKSKTEKLLSILHEKGMKGRPTIDKCKKLRKKIETKKEISELDMSNIIQTEGRPKRGSGGITQKTLKIENSPAEKRFSRLKDIFDSEDSD